MVNYLLGYKRFVSHNNLFFFLTLNSRNSIQITIFGSIFWNFFCVYQKLENVFQLHSFWIRTSANFMRSRTKMKWKNVSKWSHFGFDNSLKNLSSFTLYSITLLKPEKNAWISTFIWVFLMYHNLQRNLLTKIQATFLKINVTFLLHICYN